MLWLGLHFFELELEVFNQASTADLANPPTVVLASNKVVCRNLEAIAAGVLPGATLATAHTIATDLVHHHKDPVREHNSLTDLAECLYQLSSHISFAPPNGLILEVSRSLKLFRSSQRLQTKAVKLCESLAHKVCARLAKTPAAAIALARSGATQLEEVNLESLAPQNQPSKDLTKHLATTLGLPAASKNAFTDAVVERCHNMGIYQLGPLLALPTKELGQRFGKRLLQQLQMLTGELADPQNFIQPTEKFSRALHLLDPVRSKPGLSFPMQRLATQLQHWLIGRELAVQQIRWEFSAHDSKQASVLEIKFANPQRTSTALLNITQLKLEQLELPADILNLSLSAIQLLPWQEQSKDLFQLLSKNKSCNTRGDLVDQLRARLGDDVCETLTTQDQYHPQWAQQSQRAEQAITKQAMSRRQVSGSTTGSTTGNPTGAPLNSRPLWLLPEPKPLAKNRVQPVLLQGPERIRTGWWQEGIFRDYYVARLGNGSHGWVFVDAQQQWYLHGYFS